MFIIYTGPMFAGKTTHLIADFKNKGGMVFKPAIDTRYGKGTITSHDGWSCPVTRVSCLGDIAKAFNTHHVFIDEVQFMSEPNFDGDIVDLVHRLQEHGINVTASGLDMDFTGTMFQNMQELIDMADKHVKLNATCEVCGEPATMTYKKTPSTQLIEIGGKDIYEPRCFNCWNEKS